VFRNREEDVVERSRFFIGRFKLLRELVVRPLKRNIVDIKHKTFQCRENV